MLRDSNLVFPLLDQVPLIVWAILAGTLTGIMTAIGTRKALADCDLQPGWWPWGCGAIGLLLGTAFVMAVLDGRVQQTPDVIPEEGYRQGRVIYHLALIGLLLMMTATDLRSFYILDWCCWTGIAVALGGAVLSGQFQLAHVWIDWNQEIPQLRPAYVPQWIKLHQHWHGLAWSLAGLACGATITALIRWGGRRLLGINALGSGDVFLMAMIGAFLGWQPTVVVLLLAPVLALVIGGIIRLRGNQAALPYGPFLALAALIVLFSWRFIWMAEFTLSNHPRAARESLFAVRRFFGDPIAMALAAGLAIVLFVLLLGAIRLYRTLPIGRRHSAGPAVEASPQSSSSRTANAPDDQAKAESDDPVERSPRRGQ